jgi:hypothetical protein
MKQFSFLLATAVVFLASLLNPTVAQPPPPPGNYPWSDNFSSYADFGGSLTSGGWTGPATTFNCYGNHGNGSKGMTRQFSNSSTTTFINTPSVGPLDAVAELKFDYRIVDATLYPSSATILPQDASIVFELSSNSGVSFANILTINAGNHVTSTSFAARTVSLAAYNGQTVIVRITVNRGSSGDYFVDFDNFSMAAASSTSIIQEESSDWIWNQNDRGIFSLRSNIGMPNGSLKVWSIKGELVAETSVVAGSALFDLSSQPSGIFIVSLATAQGQIRRKIVLP